jgi:hypothetical protein
VDDKGGGGALTAVRTEGFCSPTTEQIETAARLANAHDFIMELPDGCGIQCQGESRFGSTVDERAERPRDGPGALG